MSATVDSRWLVAALAQEVHDFVICAGSRSAPLTYAVADAEAAGIVLAHPFFDECAAGFFALGLAQSTGRPVAVVTTSGTAPAHLLPAVIEAFHTNAPLIVISADRPFEMHGVGASQTTRQDDLFGSHVVSLLDVPAGLGISPTAHSISEDAAAKSLVGRVRRLLASAMGVRGGAPGLGGPAHINMGLRDPLVPQPGEPSVADLDVGSWDAVRQTVGSAPAWEDVVEPLRTVIVAGDKAGTLASELAQAAGAPLLAEPSSGAFGMPGWIAHQQQMLTHFGDEVEQVVVLGHPSLSRPVTRLLARDDVRVIVCSQKPDYTDVFGNASVVVDSIKPAVSPMPMQDWAETWVQRSAQITRQLSALKLPDGARAANSVWAHYASDPSHALVLGASNPIRFVDLVASEPVKMPAKALPAMEIGPVHAARGQAGIDGTIATAKGISVGLDMPVRVLVGDLTFMHDMNSLINRAGEQTPNVDVVVIEDRGGRIFKSLEHGLADADLYERFFAIGHDLDYRALAESAGWEYLVIDYQDTEAESDLEQALSAAPSGRIIHVRANHENIRDEIRSLFSDNVQELKRNA